MKKHWKLHTCAIIIFALLVTVIFMIAADLGLFFIAAIVLLIAMVGWYFGVIFAFYVLPDIVDKAVNSILGSNEEIEPPPYQEAHLATARGDHAEAILVFEKGIESDPEDTQPWIEISKIQLKLNKPKTAIKTLRQAITQGDWSDRDTARIMSRIADIQSTQLADQAAATETLESIIEQFPNTSQSANAKSSLRKIAPSPGFQPKIILAEET